MANEPELSERSKRATSSVIRDLLDVADRPGMLSLAGGVPSAELLPAERMLRAVDTILGPGGHLGSRSLQYGPTRGSVELRHVLGVRHGWDPESVVVTTGSQQAIDLVARVIVDPGDLVVVEAPGYLGALQVFRECGAILKAISGDDDGMRTTDLEDALVGGCRPKFVYVVADFVNPTGATLSPDRRRHLVDLAERFGFLIVEDTAYSELRWSGPASSPLGSMTDLAATIGSASKILAPGLRIGWIHGPRWLTDAVVKAKQVADLHTSSLDQFAIAEVLGDRAFMTNHLARVRSIYSGRATALSDSLGLRFGHRLEFSQPRGGMFVWARFVDGTRGDDLLRRAIEAGVAFVPGSAFSCDRTHADAMRLCFSTLGRAEIDEAVRRLADCHSDLTGYLGGRPPRVFPVAVKQAVSRKEKRIKWQQVP